MDIDYSGEKFAFPSDFTVEPAKGLTKREWFMGMAMMGLRANPHVMQEEHEMIARIAIEAADAMIEELGK